MKKWLLSSVLILILSVLAACGSETSGGKEGKEKEAEGLYSDGTLTVGVSAGPHEQILEKVKELAKEKDLNIELKVFTDYVMPNVALDEKEIDINVFQHEPYLDQFKEDRKLDLVKFGEAVNFPMGIYSSKVKDVKDLKKGGKIGLPNDPTNGARALILFEQAGLIKLKEGVGVKATVKDIEENKNDYEFIELEASQIPRQLDELEAAGINTNFAVEHGFVPTKDSIFIEPKDSPWVNIMAARTESKDDEVLQKFIDIYQTDEVKQFIEDTFQGSVVTAW